MTEDQEKVWNRLKYGVPRPVTWPYGIKWYSQDDCDRILAVQKTAREMLKSYKLENIFNELQKGIYDED